MIYFYSGTPGSGKSLSMAQYAEFWVKKLGKNIITNTFIDRNAILKKNKSGGQIFYYENEEITPDLLITYALKNHDIGKEGQTLIIFDEAQVKFSPTAVKLKCQENKNYRMEWLDFFTQHRHLGYDILMISQFDRLIDPQIRVLFEYNYIHRKANNLGTLGLLLSILHITFFVQVKKWYGVNEAIGTKFFFYKKKYAKIYNSYAYRDQIIKKLEAKYGKEKMSELMGFRSKKKINKILFLPGDKKMF